MMLLMGNLRNRPQCKYSLSHMYECTAGPVDICLPTDTISLVAVFLDGKTSMGKLKWMSRDPKGSLHMRVGEVGNNCIQCHYIHRSD